MAMQNQNPIQASDLPVRKVNEVLASFMLVTDVLWAQAAIILIAIIIVSFECMVRQIR